MVLSNRKIGKYKPLIVNIIRRGWKVDQLIVIMVGARATTHTPSMESFETTPKVSMKHTFEEIYVIAIQYAMSKTIHKRRIDNNEPLPIDTKPL